jgi:hypothetical protein
MRVSSIRTDMRTSDRHGWLYSVARVRSCSVEISHPRFEVPLQKRSKLETSNPGLLCKACRVLLRGMFKPSNISSSEKSAFCLGSLIFSNDSVCRNLYTIAWIPFLLGSVTLYNLCRNFLLAFHIAIHTWILVLIYSRAISAHAVIGRTECLI